MISFRWVTFGVITLILVSTGFRADARELYAVTALWPPFVVQGDDGPAGSDVEIARRVFETMGHTLTVRIVPWKRSIVEVKRLQADMVISIGKTDDRTAFMIYPDEHVNICRWVLFFRKESPFTYTGIESLEGKHIGTLLGYHYGDEFMASGAFHRDEVGTPEQNLKKLVSGRVDLIIENRLTGRIIAQKLGEGDMIDHTDAPIATSSLLYVAFSRKNGNEVLAQEFSRALKAFKKNRDYLTIIKRYQDGID